MKLLRELLFPVIAVLVAFVVGGVIVWVIGDNPFEVYGLLLGSALTWPDGIGYTLFYATPLIFTGLAVAVAFRCGLLNIGADEVITTIMMNFIAVALVSYFTQYYYKAPGDPIMESVPIGEAAHIPRLGAFVPGLPERLPLNVSFLLAMLACVLVYIFLWRTKWGYEIRATGSNPSAAEYGGINVRKQIVLAMAVS